jgi:hypothetical protein
MKARLTAKTRNTTLNAAFREWLVQFAKHQGNMEEFDALMRRLSYVKIDRKFTRDDDYGR